MILSDNKKAVEAAGKKGKEMKPWIKAVAVAACLAMTIGMIACSSAAVEEDPAPADSSSITQSETETGSSVPESSGSISERPATSSSKETVEKEPVASDSSSEDESVEESESEAAESVSAASSTGKTVTAGSDVGNTVSTTTTTEKPESESASSTGDLKCGSVGHWRDGTCRVCGSTFDYVKMNVCGACGKTGHLRSDCPAPCALCGSGDHGAFWCTAKPCKICGGNDHVTRMCNGIVMEVRPDYSGDGGASVFVCDQCDREWNGAWKPYWKDNTYCCEDCARESGRFCLTCMTELVDGSCPTCNPPAPTCPVCGTTAHTTHPTCPDCGSKDHTVHPTCGVCGSKDHTSHPTCGVCGSTDHTSHPTCGVCGSTDHTSHPTCPTCGSIDHTTHPEEPGTVEDPKPIGGNMDKETVVEIAPETGNNGAGGNHVSRP